MRDLGGDPRALAFLIRDWKFDKYAELQSVQVAATFCAGASLATLSWTKTPSPHWLTTALWFSSLICSIWAIVTSIQTRSILDDLPNREQLTSHFPDAEVRRIRYVILRYKGRPSVMHWVMLFAWQFPSMMMAWAWCTFLAGLTVYVCTPFVKGSRWEEGHKIAVVYLAVGSVGLVTYFFSSIFVYTSERSCVRATGSCSRSATSYGLPTTSGRDSTQHVVESGSDIESSPASPATESQDKEQEMDGHVEGGDGGPAARRRMTVPAVMSGEPWRVGARRGRDRREVWMLI
ncbi:uncharacterized protein EI97DRAFT_459670 [Westerdykella ornata]|uniref:DUF6535 domain-containing protein n=1 Tax=Westerdykella ornata TaxID=318751 RepID=A0A6A6JFP1_WESOR|nr:uncharacterized protein EI97DRAFT_459670 [Westerdykella ornata]KAF2275034.1 hypothetical protein EI97DRAFT_459670 [Westerdykella ornata]